MIQLFDLAQSQLCVRASSRVCKTNIQLLYRNKASYSHYPAKIFDVFKVYLTRIVKKLTSWEIRSHGKSGTSWSEL